MNKLKKIALKQTIGFVVEVFLFCFTGYFVALKSNWYILTFMIGLYVALIVADWIKEYSVLEYKEVQKQNG